jgi:hypothetical protein
VSNRVFAMPSQRQDGAFRDTVESLGEEIGRIVADRQALREAGADNVALEENRRRLAAAQNKLSHLLIERYLPERGVA